MDKKEEIVKKLQKAGFVPGFFTPSFDQLAEWVINDRARIVEPLVRKYPITNDAEQVDICIKAITETLINAGIDIDDIGS